MTHSRIAGIGAIARWMVCGAIIGVLGGLTLTSSAAPAPASAVTLPYALHDNLGGQWDIQPDGCIGPGNVGPNGVGPNVDIFDAGAKLTVNSADYAPTTPGALLDAAHNELVFPVMNLGGLNVSRRVSVDARQGFCRFVEILENPGAAAIDVQLHWSFQIGGSVQSSRNVGEDSKTHKSIGMALFDGARGIAMAGAGRGSAVTPIYEPQLNTDQIAMSCQVSAPAHKTVAVVHITAVRASAEEAADFIDKLSEAQVLHDLPGNVRQAVVNFRAHLNAYGDFDFIRNELLDTIETRDGDQYRGVIQDKAYSLATAYGLVDLPAERVLGLFSIGEIRPEQLLVTRDGEAFGGALRSPALHLLLSSGQVTPIPVSSISRLCYRMPADASDGFKYAHPMLMLRNGDRIAVDIPPDPISVSTRYGKLVLPPASIAALVFTADDQPVHQLLLNDGSRISALVDKDALELRPISTGSAGKVRFPASTVLRLQISPRTQDPAELAPTLLTTCGDRLVGPLYGKLLIATAFDVLEVNGAEVRSVHHAGTAPFDVTVNLWDDTSITGRLKGDAVKVLLGSGQMLHVPVDLIDQYAQPQPQAPASILQIVRQRVADLGSSNAGEVDQAAAALGSLGPKIAPSLRVVRAEQPAVIQAQIDKILLSLEGPATRPSTTAPAEP